MRSTVDYQLKEGEEIETLILSAIGLIVGKGNSVNNVITVTGGGYGSLYGEGGNDTITGAAGSDNIRGGSGNDKLVGGDGDDELDGGTGKDVMTGGKGNDVYVVDDVGDKVTELAKQGDDWVDSSLANYTLGANLENLSLDPAGLNGTGNALNNLLIGNDLGNLLNGAAGRDYVSGNDGNDTLKGGAGFDILEGNAGADVLYGDGDRDVFRYQIGSAGELATLGGDTIIGFKSIEDAIELHRPDRGLRHQSRSRLHRRLRLPDRWRRQHRSAVRQGRHYRRGRPGRPGDDRQCERGSGRRGGTGFLRHVGPYFGGSGERYLSSHIGADTFIQFDQDGIVGSEFQVTLATVTGMTVVATDLILETS